MDQPGEIPENGVVEFVAPKHRLERAVAAVVGSIGLGGLDVEDDDDRLLDRASFVYDALYAWSAQHAAAST